MIEKNPFSLYDFLGYFIPGALDFKNSKNITFSNDRFKHIGSIGLSFDENNQNISIQNNRFEDIAAEAIRISKTGDQLYKNSDFFVNNNIINNCANEFNSSTGIYVGLAKNITINNNAFLF